MAHNYLRVHCTHTIWRWYKCRMLRGMCIFWPCTVFFLLPLLSSLFIIRWRFRIFSPNSHFKACGRQLKKLYYHCSHVVSVTHYITCPLRPLERICLLFCNRCYIFFAINEATLCFVLFLFAFPRWRFALLLNIIDEAAECRVVQ